MHILMGAVYKTQVEAPRMYVRIYNLSPLTDKKFILHFINDYLDFDDFIITL